MHTFLLTAVFNIFSKHSKNESKLFYIPLFLHVKLYSVYSLTKSDDLVVTV